MSTIHNKMFAEFQDKALFKQAQEYGFEYLDDVLQRGVFPSEEAINNLEALREPLPELSGEGSDIIATLHEVAGPATVAQVGGRYFGMVNGGVIPTALAARELSSYWDQNPALYAISPAVATIEDVTQSWLNQLLGLPEHTVAGFVSGTSMSLLAGLAAARYRVFQRANWDVNAKGLNGAPPIRILAGREAHGTVLKAVAMLGLGTDNITWLEVDRQGRIIPENLPQLDASTILILQAGNVNSGSFDFFEQLCQQANQANAWVHIDGAFGLWAAGSRLNHLTKGIEKAQSWSVDGHKTLNTPYDSGLILCSDEEALISALQMSGAYIQHSTDRNTCRDGMYYTPEMSRRARAVELWATLKYLGKSGVDELVFGLHQRAQQFAQEISTVTGFTVLNEVVFNQVVVVCADDQQTLNVMQQIQHLRECWVGSSKWQGRTVIRVSVCSWATTVDDITRSVASFKAALALTAE